MTEYPPEASNGSRIESEQPPPRILSANPARSSRSPHTPGFEAAELYGLTVVTTKRTEKRGRGVYHCGNGDGQIACQKTTGAEHRLLSEAQADPTLRPCSECYMIDTGELLTDGGEYEAPDPMRKCPVCGERVCAEHYVRHHARCRDVADS